MRIYTNADLTEIAAALGVEASVMKEYAGRLDGARIFVKFHGKAMPESPIRTRDELLKIASSARRLFHRLAIISRGYEVEQCDRRAEEIRRPLRAGKLRKAIDAAEKNASSLLWASRTGAKRPMAPQWTSPTR